MCLNLLEIWFAFIIQILGWMYLYTGVGSSENWKPMFYNMGLSHWTILVAK